eukprot:GEMP01047756.1.p1 GENE.GEMP01047756.1~~GEMP01047756.1.p1  ORF type:complete len:115 (-),score=0.59 GEMP01047756.1:203-547(-)
MVYIVVSKMRGHFQSAPPPSVFTFWMINIVKYIFAYTGGGKGLFVRHYIFQLCLAHNKIYCFFEGRRGAHQKSTPSHARVLCAFWLEVFELREQIIYSALQLFVPFLVFFIFGP